MWVSFRAPLQPTMVEAVIRKLVNLIAYDSFHHFDHPIFWKMVRRTCCRSAHFPTSNNKVCEKKPPNKKLLEYLIFNLHLLHWFLFRNILLSEKYQVHYVGKFYLKNTFEWVSLIVEDLFIVHPYEKVNSFRDFVKVLAQSLRTHLGIYFRNVFYMTKKTYFSICLLLNLSIV